MRAIFAWESFVYRPNDGVHAMDSNNSYMVCNHTDLKNGHHMTA